MSHGRRCGLSRERSHVGERAQRRRIAQGDGPPLIDGAACPRTHCRSVAASDSSGESRLQDQPGLWPRRHGSRASSRRREAVVCADCDPQRVVPRGRSGLRYRDGHLSVSPRWRPAALAADPSASGGGTLKRKEPREPRCRTARLVQGDDQRPGYRALCGATRLSCRRRFGSALPQKPRLFRCRVGGYANAERLRRGEEPGSRSAGVAPAGAAQT
jgi:hypothetical protein